MYKQFRSTALAAALFSMLGGAAVSAGAAPLLPARPEILKADLSEPIRNKDLSVLVFMPKRCEGRDVPMLCSQFRSFDPGRDSFFYMAESRIAQRTSIAGQVQALPAALKARRYVMLLDWKYTLAKSPVFTRPTLNGEVVVYDQAAKKVVWHAVALKETVVPLLGSLAETYIRNAAVGAVGNYTDLQRKAAAQGIGIGDLVAGPAAGVQQLVVFNRRQDPKGHVDASSAYVAIGKVGAGVLDQLRFNMPADTYVALNLPAGKYRIEHHGDKDPVEFDAGSGTLAYKLEHGGLFGPNFRIDAVKPEAIEQERLATRNLLAPDLAQASKQRLTLLDWADVPVAPGTPESEELPVETVAAAPAAPRPVRAERATARVRIIGPVGYASDLFPNSACYRKTTALQGAAAAFESASKALSQSRGTFGFGGVFGVAAALVTAPKEDRSVRIGMKDTPALLRLKEREKGFLPATVREVEVTAGQPVTVTVAYADSAGPQVNRCRVAGSFVPEAGADYEASFDYSGDRCQAYVNEIDAVQGGEASAGVKLAPAFECR